MLRWVFRILGVILSLAILLGAGLLLLPADRVAQIAADQLRSVTGRDVTMTGVSLSFWPVLGASVDQLELGNADWSEQGPMLSTQNAKIGIDARKLLGGEIHITNIEAQSPTIRLESRADGRASWQFTDASGAAEITTETTSDSEPQALSIARLAVTNATLIYDAEDADLLTYSGVDLTLDWPEQDGPAAINAVLHPTEAPVTATAEIDQFASFLGGDSVATSAELSSDAGNVSFDGETAISGDVSGQLSVGLSNTAQFLAALALPTVELPPALGRSINLETALSLTSQRQLSLRELTADLGGNRLAGQADVNLNGVPLIRASINAGALDLKPALDGGPSSAGSSSTSSASGGWSKAPIDASGLASFNGDIALSADSIDLGSLKLGPTRASLKNDRSRMVFGLEQVAAYSGYLNGEFVMNNRNGLSVGGNLSGTGLEMQGLLSDLAGLKRLTGQANMTLKFLGVGESVHAIVNSLSGEGGVSIGRGTIEGIDLDELMGRGDGQGGTTVFDSVKASFAMQNGQLVNEDLLLTLSRFEARGKGRVGLGAQDLDYVFTPIALKADNGRGIAIPVRIVGPWSRPKIQPDFGAAIEFRLEEEKKKVEQKIRTKVEEKVQEELGVSIDDRKSIEKELEKRLENEVGNRLRKLFD